MRWLAFTIIIAGGCETLSPFEKPADAQAVSQSQLAPASHAAAERLDRVGRQIISTNPFLASAPAFGFVGTKEPELFHQNAEAVFASEGLIAKCRTDDELAALLCVELARITIESRTLARMGLADPDTDLPGSKAEVEPELADLGGGDSVGTASNPAKRIRSTATGNVLEFAAELHRNAGYKPELFAVAKSILQEAERHSATAKQLTGAARVPQWTK